jgi:hypothetical protein
VAFPEDFHSTSFDDVKWMKRSQRHQETARRKLFGYLSKGKGKLTDEEFEEVRAGFQRSFNIHYLRSLMGLERLVQIPDDVRRLRTIPNNDVVGLIGMNHLPHMREAVETGRLHEKENANIHFIVPRSVAEEPAWEDGYEKEWPMILSLERPDGSRYERPIIFPMRKPTKAELDKLRESMK